MAFEETPHSTKRSGSRTRTPRPTTPLRPSSRSSFRDSARTVGDGDAPFPLNAFEPALAELSDAMTDLEANMMHFQLMHESLARFSESFASFLYGLNMNAFCVDFPEVLASSAGDLITLLLWLTVVFFKAPILESFRRSQQQDTRLPETHNAETDPEVTFIQEHDLSIKDIANRACRPHAVAQLEGERQLVRQVN
ncbi:DASH subunit Dam1 [Cordyceps militaris]|uniref:DASH complex subunit DAM1 n=1 Tax=Cordyceps militaris TaxID=73501 RepID=A0A2H4SP02_CORMI|nr:DASH subunit Dam1 [Cordyceps militaris]